MHVNTPPPQLWQGRAWWPQGAVAWGTADYPGFIKLLSQEEHRVRLAEHRIINLHVYVQAQIISFGSVLTRPLIHLFKRLAFTATSQ